MIIDSLVSQLSNYISYVPCHLLISYTVSLSEQSKVALL